MVPGIMPQLRKRRRLVAPPEGAFSEAWWEEHVEEHVPLGVPCPRELIDGWGRAVYGLRAADGVDDLEKKGRRIDAALRNLAKVEASAPSADIERHRQRLREDRKRISGFAATGDPDLELFYKNLQNLYETWHRGNIGRGYYATASLQRFLAGACFYCGFGRSNPHTLRDIVKRFRRNRTLEPIALKGQGNLIVDACVLSVAMRIWLESTRQLCLPKPQS
jgi:hypothetical protein